MFRQKYKNNSLVVQQREFYFEQNLKNLATTQRREPLRQELLQLLQQQEPQLQP